MFPCPTKAFQAITQAFERLSNPEQFADEEEEEEKGKPKVKKLAYHTNTLPYDPIALSPCAHIILTPCPYDTLTQGEEAGTEQRRLQAHRCT